MVGSVSSPVRMHRFFILHSEICSDIVSDGMKMDQVYFSSGGEKEVFPVPKTDTSNNDNDQTTTPLKFYFTSSLELVGPPDHRSICDHQ
ncbi:hypothetical protein JTB14_013011 [Gonioctena quinquepunctata]|nr:hypothetical protein JTB14_013011 [Gonioctena quinquepunctata]